MDNGSNEYEEIKKQNLKELEEFLADTLDDEDYRNIIKQQEQQKNVKPKRPINRNKNIDKTYVPFVNYSPSERRSSARLLKKPAEYKYNDLKDEDSDEHSATDIDNLEDVILPRKKLQATRKITEPFVIVPVESITQSYLANIAKRATNKKYSQNGTSCHQCRQKTLDSKTYCRNTTCVGVRGQFCGPCLANRYGEDAAVALKDPNWKCPPCKGICNCSICRTREGKRPTGILAPLAFKHGHNSVKDFLQSLNGKGDLQEKEEEIIYSDDDGDLLGFTKDMEAVLLKE